MELVDRRNRGFFWADNAIIRQYGKRLGPNGIAVYMALACHVGSERTCFPSYATIAEEVGMSRRGVINAINQIAALGLIAVTPRHSDDGRIHNSNLYTLLNAPPIIASDDGEGSAGTTPASEPGALPSAGHAPGVVQDMHQGSAPHALGVVHHMHPKDTQLEQDPMNKTQGEEDPKKAADLSPIHTRAHTRAHTREDAPDADAPPPISSELIRSVEVTAGISGPAMRMIIHKFKPLCDTAGISLLEEAALYRDKMQRTGRTTSSVSFRNWLTRELERTPSEGERRQSTRQSAPTTAAPPPRTVSFLTYQQIQARKKASA